MKNDKAYFEEIAQAKSIDNEDLKFVEGGKTETATLRLVATVAPKFKAFHTTNGIQIQGNIPNATVETQSTSDGAIVTIKAI